jgi:hypothetical protein
MVGVDVGGDDLVHGTPDFADGDAVGWVRSAWRTRRISAGGSVVAYSVVTQARGLTRDSDLTAIMESTLDCGTVAVSE